MSLWHRHLNQPRLSPETSGGWVRPTPPSAGPGRGTGTHRTPVPAYADGMKGSLLGPAFSSEEIGAWLTREGYPAQAYTSEELAREVARLLADEKVVGLFQGRMEFGPRALGARSILGDARSPRMQSVMNLKIKHRESFRPFAPAVLREHVAEWFDLDADSPYMLLVADVTPAHRLEASASAKSLWGIDRLNVPRSDIPVVTHVDYSARIQTVRPDTNPIFHAIIEAFSHLTGCPVIVNTSFNVRGEPIVCTPEDAYRCFMRTDMDALVFERHLLHKTDQVPAEVSDAWKEEFALD